MALGADYKTEINLTLPVPPITNQRLQKSGNHFYRKKENTLYQKEVRLICLGKRIKPILGEVSMSIIWYRKECRGDIDSRWKDLCDALEGVAYENDRFIKIFTVLRDDTQKTNPRIEVKITPYY